MSRLKPYFVDWAAMEKLVLTEQRPNYLAFRLRCETYLRRVLSIPEEPPQIDWEAYKKMLPDENIVNRMKSYYEAFQVPFPKDTQTSLIEEQWKSLEPKIKEYCADVQKDIDIATKELARLKSLPMFSDMTMEMYRDAYPEEALDSVNRPTFWPHDHTEQEGYQLTEAELYNPRD